jgi:Zn-dependent protease
MAILWAVILKICLLFSANPQWYWLIQPLIYMCGAGILINSILMVLNLFPLPPLDGDRVVAGLLPGPLAYKFSKIEPYCLIILIVLFISDILAAIISPIVSVFVIALSSVFNFLPVMKYIFPY